MHPRATKRTKKPSPLSRAQVVWIAFTGSMTLLGGVLLLLDTRPVPRTDGLSYAPLVNTSGSAGDRLLRTTRTPLDAQRWRAIVIHHSDSPADNPATIGRRHEQTGRKGLGYHFVIGNGEGMADGELYAGYRWLDQQPGAHVVSAAPDANWFNQHAVSVCLVGDGNREPFTDAQLHMLQALLQSLRHTLDIPDGRTYLHADIAPGVQSPGTLFPVELIDD